jgi:hypothetical protein
VSQNVVNPSVASDIGQPQKMPVGSLSTSARRDSRSGPQTAAGIRASAGVGQLSTNATPLWMRRNVCPCDTNLFRLKTRTIPIPHSPHKGWRCVSHNWVVSSLVVRSIKLGPSTLTHPILNAGPAPTLPEEQLGTPHPPRFRCQVGFLFLKGAPSNP